MKKKTLTTICITSLIIALVLAYLVITNNSLVNNIDTIIQSSFARNDLLTLIMTVITETGDGNTLMILSGVMLALLLIKHKYNIALILIIGMTGGLLIGTSMKYLIMRPRPVNMLVQENSPSFPSGHALMSMIFYNIIIQSFNSVIKNKTAKKLFTITIIVLVIMIGLSRLYLKVHYLSDVTEGYFIGTSWITLTILLSNTKSFKEITRTMSNETSKIMNWLNKEK